MFKTIALSYFLPISLAVSTLYTLIYCYFLHRFWFFCILSVNSSFYLSSVCWFCFIIMPQWIFIISCLIYNRICLLNMPLPIFYCSFFFIFCFGFFLVCTCLDILECVLMVTLAFFSFTTVYEIFSHMSITVFHALFILCFLSVSFSLVFLHTDIFFA